MSMLSRRSFLKSTVAAASALSSASRVPALSSGSRPNVLFIAVDDQNVQLGCYGASHIHSPNIDRLAARGTRFAHAYCQYPLCGPSRASLMTGLAPDTTKIYGLDKHVRDTMPDVVTLGQLFRKNGYFSARVGKVFHQDVPAGIGQDGMDDPACWDSTFNPAGEDHLQDEPKITNFTPRLTRHGEDGAARLGSTISFFESAADDHAMTDGKGADEVIRLLREKRNQPFFLAFGLYRPHVPWIVPKKYFDLYSLEAIKPRPFNPAELTQAPPVAYSTRVPNYGMSEMQCRQAIRAYAASTSFMDAQVGRVLAELKALRLEANTVVVFWADHGWSLGEHGQWQKQTLFESANQVPLIFAGPGIPSGLTVSPPAEHLDVYPSLVDLCSLHGAPTELHGSSLFRTVEKKGTGGKLAVSQLVKRGEGEGRAFGYSLRTERYRYTAWLGGSTGEELYDYVEDPSETRNMAADAQMKNLRDGLRRQLAAITAARGRSIAMEA